MKQVININYHGRIIPIEVTAIEILKSYITNLENHFANELGKEEIINDIENRISELFQEHLTKGSVCITDEIVNSVINNMGMPNQIDDQTATGNDTNTSTRDEKNYPKESKRFFRKEKNKIIGGVCAGLAEYMGIDIVIVRVIFLVLFFSFGFGLLPYLILWIAAPSTASENVGSTKKKLFRDTDNQMIAGVCSGLAHFFGIDIWIPRVLFLLPLIGIVFQWNWHGLLNFTPGSLIAYIICWLVIPEAKTTAEKLEMKGEKIDLHTIKETITKELKDVKERIEEKGKEIKKEVENKAPGAIHRFLNRCSQWIRAVIKVIILLIKGILLLLIGSIALTLVLSLLAIALGSFTVFPMAHFILDGFWQNLFAIGIVLFFFITPAVAIVTWIIRKLAGIKSKNKWLRISFLSLWILGWISIFGLVSLIGRDFSRSSQLNPTPININHPETKKMELMILTSNDFFSRKETLDFEDFLSYSDSALYLPQVSVCLKKANTDQFSASIQKKSNGKTVTQANQLANQFEFTINSKDSIISINRGITIPNHSIFRNQRATVTIYVPIGKEITLTRAGSIHQNSDKEWIFSNWQPNQGETVTYIMTEQGIVEKSYFSMSAPAAAPTINPHQKQIDSLLKEKMKVENQILNLQQ